MKEECSKILRVNLNTHSSAEECARELEDRFLGGRGVGAWILFNELADGIEPLDPRNIIIFSVGPLTGTAFPGSARLSITSKSCMTGGINWGNVGGFFASELSHSGWNHLVISGRSSTPIYLYISNNKIEFRNAAHLWGADTWETEDIIRNELSDLRIQVLSIGIAGENLVPFSVIITNRTRAAASGGLGAIMGSKNLKAIAVRGTLRRPVSHPREFSRISKLFSAKLKRTKCTKGLRKDGTFGFFITPVNDANLYSYRNTQDDHYEDIEKSAIAWANWRKIKKSWDSCSNCPIECGRFFLEADQGPYRGLRVPVPEHNTHIAFGARLDMTSPSHILKAFEMISRYGLDNDAVAVVISWAFECYEKGILTKADTDSLELTWGNNDAVISLIRKIALRQGFGEVLSRGCEKASETIGKGSDYYCSSQKGQDNLDVFRVDKGWGLGVAASLRGGRHLDGAPNTEFSSENMEEASKKLFAISTAFMPTTYEEKGKLVSWYSHFKAAIDALGVCYFTSWWSSIDHLGPDEYGSALSALLGKEIQGQDLMRYGERIHNVEKAFNSLHTDFERKHDYPPLIFFEEPIKSGKFKGEMLSRQKYDEMLNEFYEAKHWDIKTGLQFESHLIDLGLPEVAKRLAEAGKLLESNG
jgi:aldehyde:ferredoxin oxidoreductase